MTATHERFDELAAAYALDALAGRDADEFQAHLAGGCPECERTLGEYREALAHVAADLREEPPPDVKVRVLRHVARDRVARRRIGPTLGWAASVALAASIAAWVTNAHVGRHYEERLAAMAGEAAALRAQIAEQAKTLVSLRDELTAQERTLTLVRAESAAQARTLALLHDPATRVVALGGLPPAPDAQARLVWNPSAGGLLLASGLPPAPADKVYELWAIAGGTPQPAGLFTVDPEGKGTLQVAALEGVAVEVFAVTLEPAGGVPAPTGPMVLASKAA